MRRIHITGGPGAGKTTLARRLAMLTGLPVIDIDGLSLELQAAMSTPFDLAEFRAQRVPFTLQLADRDDWISDGSNLEDSLAFFERAELIIYVDWPWRVALYRILNRHLRAELARNNRFPGWRRLYRFWRWSAGYYAGTNPHATNEWGTPHTRSLLEERLRYYESKLAICRTNRDIDALIRRVSAP